MNKILKSINNKTVLLIILLLAIFGQNSRAQNTYFGGAGYGQINPVLNLNNRFKATSSLVYQFGKTVNTTDRINFLYQKIDFDKTNKSELYYDDLNLQLEIHSISSIYNYRIFERWGMSLFLNAGVSLNKWKSSRGAFFQQDTSGTIDLPDFERREWSWGANMGFQIDYSPWNFVTFGASGDYSLIVASLWPSTKVRLEQISGWQFIHTKLFMQFNVNL